MLDRVVSHFAMVASSARLRVVQPLANVEHPSDRLNDSNARTRTVARPTNPGLSASVILRLRYTGDCHLSASRYRPAATILDAIF